MIPQRQFVFNEFPQAGCYLRGALVKSKGKWNDERRACVFLDIALGLILLLSLYSGYRRGFTESFLHTVGWVLAVVLGFVWTPMVAAFLRANTGIEDGLRTTLSERLSQSASASEVLNGVPDVLRDYVSDAASVVQSRAVENLIAIVITLLALLCIILCIRLVFFLITVAFSKKKRGGLIALSDGVLGMVFGAARGALVICVLLAFFLPIANFFKAGLLLDQLHESTYAIRIYDNNPIFFLTQIFF